MSDSNFSAIRARLRYGSIEEFIDGYARFVSAGGMFVPMAANKLKPLGTVVRFQFLLADGTTALLGEGAVIQVRPPEEGNPKAPVGMLVKFSKLSQESKNLVDQIVAMKEFGAVGGPDVDEISESSVEDSEPQELVSEDPTHETNLDEFIAAEEAQAAAEAAELEAAELEAAELDVEEPEEKPAPVESDSGSHGPRKLAQTEGGLQILAFDDISDEEAGALDFGFGADEDDIDNMFAGLFGGDSEAGVDDSVFGDMFGPGDAEPEPDNEPVLEEVSEPELEQEEPDLEDEPEFEELEEEPEEFVEESEEEEFAEESDELLEDDELAAAEIGEESSGFTEDDADLQDDIDGLLAGAELSSPEEEEEEEEERSVVVDSTLFGGDSLVEDDDEYEDEEVLEVDELEEDVDELQAADEYEDDELEADEPVDPASSEEDELEADEEFEDSADDQADEFLADEGDEEPEAEDEFDDEAAEEEAPEDESSEDEPSEAESSEELDEEAFGDEGEAPAEDSEALEEEDDFEDPASIEALELDAVELIEGSEAEFLFEEEESGGAPALPDLPADVSDGGFSVSDSDEPESNELDDLLGNLDSTEEERELDLHLPNDPVAALEASEAMEDAEPAYSEDEDSLDFLLAAANADIASKRADDPATEKGADILDELLGDVANLPPPPSDAPIFGAPPQPEKKKGFLSKLFGKD